MKARVFWLMGVSILITAVVAPPVNQKVEDEAKQENDDMLSVEYARYLQEVVQALEQDEAFKSKLINASEDEIKSGKIAKELQFVNHQVRSKLDELKRQELGRIRQLTHQQMELSHGMDRRQLKVPMQKHMDSRNMHTFEIEDLRKLILQTTKDLEEADRKRRKEFKEYEMDKEHERLAQLKQMDDDHKKRAEQEYEDMQKKHRDHPKLHHPGSKPQLEEVWEKQDHLPADEFNPKTFFKLHDLDGDNYWNQEEVNIIFQNELNKMYDANMPEDDIRERYEEMERMREHVFNESDSNQDGLISYDEFMQMTKKQDFEQDPGWEGLDENPAYSREEFLEYERRREAEMQRLAAGGIHPYAGQPMHIPPGGIYPGPVYQPSPQHPGQMHYPQQQQPQQRQQPTPHYASQQQGQFAQQGYYDGGQAYGQYPQQGQQFQQPQQGQQYQQPQHPQQNIQRQQYQQYPQQAQQNVQQPTPPKQYASPQQQQQQHQQPIQQQQQYQQPIQQQPPRQQQQQQQPAQQQKTSSDVTEESVKANEVVDGKPEPAITKQTVHDVVQKSSTPDDLQNEIPRVQQV